VSGFFRVGGSAYDDFMGRYSVRLAPLFADFAGVHGGRVLDVGAGTGALTGELVRRGADVAAVEPSPEFCAALRERFPSLEVAEAPAEQLPFPDGSFDVALAPLGRVESAELEVTADYDDFEEFWHALERQVGPAGAWLASLSDEQRARAREEMHRQLGSPSGTFSLTGRCYAARVSTDARSAPVPTSVTSTSSSRSTNST